MIPDLLRFIEIDDETKGIGHEIWDLLEPHTDSVVENFYGKVNAFGIGAPVPDAVIWRLQAKQKEHWAALFGSRFDVDYVNSVRRVGIQHRDIALNPMWFVLGYMALKISFTKIIDAAALPPLRKGRLQRALDKFVAFDMAIALSTYDAVVID